MNVINKFASICLHVPGRVYDLCAIALISTGINVFTGAGGTKNEAFAITSGILLCGAGVLASLLKGQTDLVLRLAESDIEIRAKKIAQMLTGKANKNSTSTSEPVQNPSDDAEKRKKRSSLSKAIHTRLEEPKTAGIVTILFAFQLLLAAPGQSVL